MFIVIVIAWLYTIFERTPPAEWMLYGVQPVVIVIILQAMINLGKTAFKNPATISAGIVALVLYLLGYSPILVLILASLIVPIVSQAARLKDLFPIILLPSLHHWKIATETAQPFSLMTLFLTFLKIGSVLYGSGYVLLAFLESDFVHNLGWLTEQQLLEAVAVGQFTPGPVFTTATFIGYIIAGLPGAVVATIGIFLPSFIFVAISNPYIPKIRSSPWAGILLDVLNAASLGLMSAVALQLSRTAFVDLGTIVIGIISGVFLFIFRTNTTWLILAGLSIGLVIGISRFYLF
jgi:chromate transporter